MRPVAYQATPLRHRLGRNTNVVALHLRQCLIHWSRAIGTIGRYTANFSVRGGRFPHSDNTEFRVCRLVRSEQRTNGFSCHKIQHRVKL